ncbi:amidohydrolase family protein [Dermatobacter hominis]|uniref:amidohydrolase family protein n=1 Tax=Dermatobacter hominis TaxID=2884263 RepID=UPI001D104E7A|nr:amidohydrolase family protein [Dermatobacter hominis]UDY36593.1 amidohydrolase [Dermatobacter hominis]
MLDFRIVDADNHYYEATDAFTRHLDPAMAKRTMQWADVDGKRRLLVGGSINRFIPNPSFSHLAQPGSLSDFFRARSGVGDLRAAFGELQPIEQRPEYRDRDARLAVMDEQGMEACIMLPTLGVGMETALESDPQACTAAFRAFNRWLDDDWGLAYQDRIFSAPYVTLLDPEWAVEELRWALDAGARVVLMRPTSVWGAEGRRTPGDPRHDAFWSLLDESGVTLVLHSGDAGYGPYEELWGISEEMQAFKVPTLKRLLSANPIRDTMASFMADRIFERFDNLRMATVETGADWVRPLLKKLAALHVQLPGTFGEDPVELFRRHVWVSPFFEDDVLDLVDAVGVGNVLFGSDWPHVEGLAEPSEFVAELEGLDDDDVRRIMRTNAQELLTPRPR